MWSKLQKVYLEQLKSELSKYESVSKELFERVIEKLKKNGYRISGDEQEDLARFHEELERNLNYLIEKVPLSAIKRYYGASAGVLQDKVVKSIVDDVMNYTYKDGLKLSDRIWNMNTDYNTAMIKTLRLANKRKRAISNLYLELQYAFESVSGEKFKTLIKENHAKWVNSLVDAARGVIHSSDMRDWKRTVREIERYINKLARTGTYYGAKKLMSDIKKAIDLADEQLIEKALKWRLYDKQLYRLKMIARTETANAFHLTQIKLTDRDPDIIGYKWILSSRHPKDDICDEYSKQNRWRLGKGVFPPDEVPKRKPHPHCMCRIEPVYWWEADNKIRAERIKEEKDKFLTGIEGFQTRLLGLYNAFTLRDMVRKFKGMWEDEKTFEKHLRKRGLTEKGIFRVTIETLANHEIVTEQVYSNQTDTRILFSKKTGWMVVVRETSGKILSVLEIDKDLDMFIKEKNLREQNKGIIIRHIKRSANENIRRAAQGLLSERKIF